VSGEGRIVPWQQGNAEFDDGRVTWGMGKFGDTTRTGLNIHNLNFSIIEVLRQFLHARKNHYIDPALGDGGQPFPLLQHLFHSTVELLLFVGKIMPMLFKSVENFFR
jgi:hypothetical protein